MYSNPYKPGAGTMPPILAGRDNLIKEVSGHMAGISDSGIGDRSVIIWGLRGIGKTVLLNHLVTLAQDENWFVVKFEAQSGDELPTKIAQEMATILRRTRIFPEIARDAITRTLRVLKSFQLKFDPTGAIALNGSIEPEPGFADSGNRQLDFLDLCESLGETARDLGVGVLIAIDELQEADLDDLKVINMTLHALGQQARQVPLLFIGTGLPNLPATLSKANTYAERLYRYFELEPLDDESSRIALTKPAEELGVKWEETALEHITGIVDGYPYFIQQCGSCTWDVLDDAPLITYDQACTGTTIARAEIDRGLYQARWDRASDSERKMMVAMAKLGGRAVMKDVTALCGKKSTSQLSTTRDRLIKAGQIYSPDTSYVDFTVPGMADFIMRKHADDLPQT